MNALQFFEALARLVRQNAPAYIGVAYVDSFIDRYQDQLVQVIEENFGEALARKFPDAETPELWTASKRTAANLAAMKLLAAKPPEAMTESDRRVLARYSGWGGLSIAKVADQFPTGFPVPEAKGLLHEYYTPLRVWKAVERELGRWKDELPTENGRVLALEPSVGIGRALEAFASWTADWTALEVSPVSARLVRARFPGVRVEEGYAERFFARTPKRFGLVLTNPPYGARGEAAELDQAGYKTAQAYIYFVMRAAEALAAGGIMVAIIPTGLLTSRAAPFVRHRTELLRRAHLMGAFRLPSQPPEGGTLADVGYENFVVDVLFLRGRGGIAEAPTSEDLAIIEGGYYEQHPQHVLGKPVGALADASDVPTGPKVRRGYQIQGRFRGFPAWDPRPFRELTLGAQRKATRVRGGIAREVTDLPEDAPQRLRDAVSLGLRADRHLQAVARGALAEAAGGGELVRDIEAWIAAWGSPSSDPTLRGLSDAGSVGVQRFLTVTAGGRASAALAVHVEPPGYQGDRDLLAFTDWLYRQRGGLPLPVRVLSEEAQEQGLGRVDMGRVYAELWPRGWRRDGDTVEPAGAYVTGHLWPKYDRARDLAAQGDELAQQQVQELRTAIGWTGGGQLVRESAPNQPWIPLDLLVRFARETESIHWPLDEDFSRVDGLLTPKGWAYTALNNTEKARTPGFSQSALCFLGWVNADLTLFTPPRRKRVTADGNEEWIPADELRLELQEQWKKVWSDWLQKRDDVLTALEESFNRGLRGYVAPEFAPEPVSITRWSGKVKLHSYQNQAVRKLLANRCGLLAFDVGLGKTFSGIATLASARQQGWARRPVVIVPNTIAWKWFRDFARCLPDYRVVVIGANRRKVSRETGRPLSDAAASQLARSAWRWRSVLDTPEERAEKWTHFQAGLYDVALVTYSAFARQQIDRAFVERYVAKNVAIRRAITLALDQAENEDGEKKTTRKRTERSEADTHERVRAWVGAKLQPPKGWSYDTGIDWHALGVDFLMVDEAQNFKNLYYSSREGSSDRAASKRAWALDFRCASVREHSGGAGVVLLSATPMKNAATEFFNMLHLVNPAIWEQVGVGDPEGFVNLFADIQERMVTAGDGSQAKQQVVTGFHHIEALKGVVYRWATFKTAKQVGLRIPDVSRLMHVSRASEAQMELFGELFEDLKDISDRIKVAARMAKNNPAGMAALRALRMKRQGVHTRLYLAAVHPGLVSDGQAMQAPEAGPKLVQCVQAILETRPQTCSTLEDGQDWCLDCGHIVFAENVRVHTWLKTLLVRAGLKPERIAILNAESAADLEVRQQIAEQFNGMGEPTDDEYEPPRYDVVIANAVAYEGIDLQRRTCAIHHIDVPWEPATLQQRNGRGVRQGNKFGDVTLHFYFVQGSSEKHRLSKIERKRGIMASLFEEGALATNSVEADVVEADDDLADAFIEFCPPHLREALQEAAEDDRREREAAQRQAARQAANRALREALQAARRLQRADPVDEMRMAQLVNEARETREALARFPTSLWPFAWHALAAEAFDQELVKVPEDGPPLFPGLRVHFRDHHAIVTHIDDDEKAKVWAIATDGSGDPGELDPFVAEIDQVSVDNPPAEWWDRTFEHHLPFYGPHQFNPVQLARHGEAFAAVLWTRVAQRMGTHFWTRARPWVRSDGSLAADEAGGPLKATTLPPTLAGWHRFLQLAPASGMKFSDLQLVASAWWGRRLPRNLLSGAREARREAA